MHEIGSLPISKRGTQSPQPSATKAKLTLSGTQRQVRACSKSDKSDKSDTRRRPASTKMPKSPRFSASCLRTSSERQPINLDVKKKLTSQQRQRLHTTRDILVCLRNAQRPMHSQKGLRRAAQPPRPPYALIRLHLAHRPPHPAVSPRRNSTPLRFWCYGARPHQPNLRPRRQIHNHQRNNHVRLQ